MSEQCGLSIGSEMTSLNLRINGIRLKESLIDCVCEYKTF